MRRVLVAVCLSVALAGCGSSNNTSTPQAGCNSLSSTICNRFFACDSAAATTAFGTAAACTTSVETSLSCATAVCPTGKTYNANQAQTCVNDASALPCSVFTGGTVTNPPSCTTVCQ
jgi:uncharacterized lipoprotein YehR (DUF1307 family)